LTCTWDQRSWWISDKFDRLVAAKVGVGALMVSIEIVPVGVHTTEHCQKAADQMPRGVKQMAGQAVW
jgi:hypothetical protein